MMQFSELTQCLVPETGTAPRAVAAVGRNNFKAPFSNLSLTSCRFASLSTVPLPTHTVDFASGWGRSRLGRLY